MSNELKREANEARFKEVLRATGRAGIESVITMLENSDFFYAPASTKYHSSYEGGLCQHSLNVFDCLMAKKASPVWANVLKPYSNEMLAIVSLLHDVCKANIYSKAMKNVKSYEEADIKAAQPFQIKYDEHGHYVWKTVVGYTFNDEEPLGHGEKSVILLQKFITLNIDELYAIRWHMGFSENESNWNFVRKAMEKSPLVLALFEADMEASMLVERENGNIEGII